MKASDVVAAILDGRLDGDLLDVNKAIIERFKKGVTDTRWVIAVDDLVIDQDTTTVGEVRIAEKVAETSWIRLNPVATASHWVAVVAACIHKRKGVPLDKAVAQADGYPMDVVNESVTEREVAALPKD